MENYEIVKKIEYEGKIFYRTRDGKLFDENVKLIGCYVIINNNYEYYLFAEN